MEIFKLYALLTLFLFLAIYVVNLDQSVIAKINNEEASSSYNNTAPRGSNATGIMQNTTGIIDDAFNQLKDSIGSLFG